VTAALRQPADALLPRYAGRVSPAAKPSDELKDVFRALVPAEAGVTVRPMFGHIAAFLNGNMVTGLFGDGLFVRAKDADRDSLLAAGGEDFAPMPGRPMNGYVMLPSNWRTDEASTRKRIDRALAVTALLPPKQPRVKKK
jgi:TfoX/Sxy family transcriptional regulator of competence genes